MDLPMQSTAGNRRTGGILSVLFAINFTVLCLAGLWPFDFFPKNNVQWLPDQEILRFGRYGIAYSAKPIEVPGAALDLRKPVRFAFTVRPADEPGNSIPRILSLCDEEFRELLFVGQWRNELIIRISDRDGSSPGAYREAGVDNLLGRNRTSNLVVRLDESGLSVAFDGRVVLRRAGISLSRFSDLRTRVVLLLGNSPAGDSPWEGDFLGFTVLQTSAPIREPGTPIIHVADRWTAVARNDSIAGGTDLPGRVPGMVLRTGGEQGLEMFLPATFRPLRGTVLLPPWRETRLGLSFWWDVVVNVAGFIPFGFLLYGFARRRRTPGRDGVPGAILVVLLGAGLGLTFELLQAYLPSRDSSLTDVLSNAAGSFAGVLLCRSGKGIRRRLSGEA